MKIIKFSALWCADCIVMRPMWAEIEIKFPELEIKEIDFDDETELAKEHGVTKVPFFIFFDKSGNELARRQGMQNKEDLMKLIEENLNN